MIGAFIDLITLRRFYPTRRQENDKETKEPLSVTASLDPSREASDLAKHVTKGVKLCDKIALMAVEDAVFLMERIYAERFGREAFEALELTPVTGRLGRIYDADDHDRYDDSVLVDRLFERYDNLIQALDSGGDLQRYNQANVTDPVAVLREIECLAAYLAIRGIVRK